MKCLVTGGAGFIGSNLVDKLISNKHKVLAFDNQATNPSYWNLKAENFNEELIATEPWEDQIFKEFKPDWVFHLAAQPSIPFCIEHPYESMEENLNFTIKMLELSRQHKVKKFIFSSTSAIYGLKNKPPLKESMNADCLNPYSAAKLSAEILCKMYYTLYGLKTVSLRYFNVYGKRQRDVGQYAPVIGTFLNQHYNKQDLTVVGNGKQIRDYIHVNDVVSANISAAKSKDERTYGEIFNIGTGKGYNVLDVANMIGGNIRHIPERAGEAKVSLSDNSKAKKLLKWKPNYKLEDYIEGELKYYV
tara:strand:- start:867 stop:1775 length:909 start_codon:yes stop_codon:yes gene_type:complete